MTTLTSQVVAPMLSLAMDPISTAAPVYSSGVPMAPGEAPIYSEGSTVYSDESGMPSSVLGPGEASRYFSESGTYNADRYQNTEVVIRAIEGFIKEAIASNFADLKFTISPVYSDSTRSSFQAINSAGTTWDIGVEVSDGNYSFSINNDAGFGQGIIDTFSDVATELNASLSMVINHVEPGLSRAWKNRRGNSTRGVVTSCESGRVKFKRESDQKSFNVSLDIFCDADQALIKQRFVDNQALASRNSP